MAIRYSRAAHTVRAKEITLPENFDTLEPDFDGWEKILTSANSPRMAANNIVTPEGPETATPLFSPEQQAWIESLIQDRTSRTPGEQDTSSSATVTTPPPAPPHASTSSGNVGKPNESNDSIWQ
jgi:hypothetical protein